MVTHSRFNKKRQNFFKFTTAKTAKFTTVFCVYVKLPNIYLKKNMKQNAMLKTSIDSGLSQVSNLRKNSKTAKKIEQNGSEKLYKI